VVDTEEEGVVLLLLLLLLLEVEEAQEAKSPVAEDVDTFVPSKLLPLLSVLEEADAVFVFVDASLPSPPPS